MSIIIDIHLTPLLIKMIMMKVIHDNAPCDLSYFTMEELNFTTQNFNNDKYHLLIP